VPSPTTWTAALLTLTALFASPGCAPPTPAREPPPASPPARTARVTQLPDRAEKPPLPGPVFSEELRRKRAEAQRQRTPDRSNERATVATTDAPERASTSSPEPPGEEMARALAARIRQPGAPAAALPAPHEPQETNNYFSLVRSANDLANARPTYALSDDGKKLAFVRKDDLTLWIAASDGTHARKLFTANQDKHVDRTGKEEILVTSGIFDLAFSPGGQLLYFQTDLAATSLGLQMYDERTSRVQTITSANGYGVIKDCSKKPSLNGHLIAYRHDYAIRIASATDLYFLLGPRGDDLGPIGPDSSNVARFLHNECAQGAAVAAPEQATVPPEMRRTVLCGELAFRFRPLKFLDGSVWNLFYVVNKSKAAVPRRDLEMDDFESNDMELEEATEVLKDCQAHQ
jgi:hypothetical protein